MFKGKKTCEMLKAVRKQIADANNIPFEPIHCTHKGNCRGTCPACESETRYIEEQLDLRRLAGQTIKIVGVATSLFAMSACNTAPPVEPSLPSNDSVDAEPLPITGATDSVVGRIVEDEKTRVYSVCDSAFNKSQIKEGEISECLIVTEKAEFPGGKQELSNFLSENIVYPKSAHDMGISGTVHVRFIVAADGSIHKVEVSRSIDPVLDREAVRVVKSMPKWKPAKHDDKSIPSIFILPIDFTLNE